MILLFESGQAESPIHIKFASSACKLAWINSVRRLPGHKTAEAVAAASDALSSSTLEDDTSRPPPSSCSDDAAQLCEDDPVCFDDDGFAWGEDDDVRAAWRIQDGEETADTLSADAAPSSRSPDDEAERTRWSLTSSADCVSATESSGPPSPTVRPAVAAAIAAALADDGDSGPRLLPPRPAAPRPTPPDVGGPDADVHAVAAPPRAAWLFGSGASRKAPGLVMSSRQGRPRP